MPSSHFGSFFAGVRAQRYLRRQEEGLARDPIADAHHCHSRPSLMAVFRCWLICPGRTSKLLPLLVIASSRYLREKCLSQLIELKWTGGPAVDSSGTAVKSSGEGLDWQLRVLQKWTLQGLVDTEGITHTPSALDGEGGSLYISTKHDIHVFEVPPSGSAAAFSVSSALSKKQTLNTKLLGGWFKRPKNCSLTVL